MNRRSVLRGSALALPVLLSGCSALQSSEPRTVEVSEITLRSRLDREIDVSVLLTEDGEVAYWQTVTVPSSPNPFATVDDLPERAGAYRLYAQVPETGDDSPVGADLVADSGESDCISVYMEVTTTDARGEKVPSVAYGSIGDCQNGE